MGIYEIVGIAIFVLIGGMLYLAETESVSDKAKRLIACAALVLFAGGTATLFLVEDRLGDWSKPAPPPKSAKKKGDETMVGTKTGGEKDGKKKVIVVDDGANSDKADEEGAEVTNVAADAAGDAAKAVKNAAGINDCDDCPEMVVLPVGAFSMGSTRGEIGHQANEAPERDVTIAKPFAIGRFELLQREFDAFVKESGYAPAQACMVAEAFKDGHSYAKPGYKPEGRQPVTCISFNDALAYAAWLSKKTGRKYRLPSEAEWEYAARAGSFTAFASGDAIGASDAVHGGGTSGPRQVGSVAANAFSLHDVHGNAAEMVMDCWHEGYRNAPKDARAWLDRTPCKTRVLKGGAWYDTAPMLRSAARQSISMDVADNGVGFRIVREE